MIGSRRFDCRLLFDGRDVGVVVEGFGIVVWVLVACFFNIFCSLFPSYYDVSYGMLYHHASVPRFPPKGWRYVSQLPMQLAGQVIGSSLPRKNEKNDTSSSSCQQPAERHGTAMSPSICFALSYDISTNIIFRYYQSSSDR